VCVPISALPGIINFAKNELKKLNLLGYVNEHIIFFSSQFELFFNRPIVGHVGDGNFHVFVIVDPQNAEEIKRVHEYSVALAEYIFIDNLTTHFIINSSICRESLRVNGTVTGEHGVGIGKKKLLIEEFGAAGINTMKAIKQALDPLNILNPGKVI
jgi:D-lactate dehydrogenase (cytochrome)